MDKKQKVNELIKVAIDARIKGFKIDGIVIKKAAELDYELTEEEFKKFKK